MSITGIPLTPTPIVTVSLMLTLATQATPGIIYIYVYNMHNHMTLSIIDINLHIDRIQNRPRATGHSNRERPDDDAKPRQHDTTRQDKPA